MLYYLYDDTTQDLIGVDKAICSAMRLQMAENQIESIFFNQTRWGSLPNRRTPKRTNSNYQFLLAW